MDVKWLALAAVFAGSCAMLHAAPWVLRNPSAIDYVSELVRVGPDAPPDIDRGGYVLLRDGQPVPFEVWDVEGRRRILTVASLAPGLSQQYELKRDDAPAATPLDPAIKVTQRPDGIILENGRLSVRLATDGSAPIQAVRLPNGPWLGHAALHTPAKVSSVKATLGQGIAAAMARLDYAFEPSAAGAPAGRYSLDIALPPGRNYAIIRESFESLPDGSRWVFDLAAGWRPRHALVELNNEGGGAGSGGIPRDRWPGTLAAGQTRMGNTLVNLLPRWSQSFDDGWFFATHDNATLLGVLPARAGQWLWPHQTKMPVTVRPEADYAGVVLPIERGARYWLLVAGPADLAGRQRDLALRETMVSLDKINNDYILDWPGQEARGRLDLEFFYGNQTNPTGFRRQLGRNTIRDAMAGRSGDMATLLKAQQNLDPDWYGTYNRFWSPQNPNFYTDFHKVTLALVAQLRQHPRFEELRARAEAVFRADVDHSVTLPGGAGQECPGYLAHAAEQWLALAPLCRQHLGFDPTQWPRWKAVGQFILHTSQPVGSGKRAFHPGGDTHPGRPDPIDFAAKFGYRADIGRLTTEELPGFGVVFRNRPGTDRETYLAFKAGPNRGHYHGDQLSFHYCANARPLAVDHHCSYKPRAGQEHMHNRLAFSSDKLRFANMDGYERLIAFQAGPAVDIAIGQVESPRLRTAREFPPEEWDARLPEQRFDRPLRYRRTIVHLRQRDAFVIRDQYWGPELNIHFHLHVLGDRAERQGPWITCDRASLFVAAPAQFDFAAFSWEHDNGGREKTTGPRLTVRGQSAEFITVLLPGGNARDVAAINNGVQVGDYRVTFGNHLPDRSVNAGADSADADEVTITLAGQPAAAIKARDINFDRPQGDVGLFIPDAGYPFGPIPEWLIHQRGPISQRAGG